MVFRKATAADIPAVVGIYDATHDLRERGGQHYTGWVRGVYPGEGTARQALERGELFVAETDGTVVGTGIINHRQVDVYEKGAWRYPAPAEKVMVLHTLVIHPDQYGKGYGPDFVRFYQRYALKHGCPYLRIDTNQINSKARAMYKKLGFEEIGVEPCIFNGIEDVNLVLLEKKLPEEQAEG